MLVNPTLTKKNRIVFVITVAFLRSVSKIKRILALINIQETKGQLYHPFRAQLVEFIHFSPFLCDFYTFLVPGRSKNLLHDFYAFLVPGRSKNLLRDFYEFFSTRKIQKSPTRFLRIFKYRKDTKQQINAAIGHRVKNLIVQRRGTSVHLLCAIVGDIDQTILGGPNSTLIVDLLSSGGAHRPLFVWLIGVLNLLAGHISP